MRRAGRSRIPLLAAAVLLIEAGLAVAGNTPGAGTSAGDGVSLAAAEGRPPVLAGVGFEQKLGARLPLDLVFRDESGAEIQLGELFGERPVLLSLGYYGCPMLCPLVMDGLVRSLKPLSFSAGREFEVLTLSIDPEEGPEQARKRRQQSLERYDRKGSEKGWHFLTGSADSIARLTQAVGFRYRRDEVSGEYAHAAGVVIVTPNGEVSRYLFGAEYAPRDLRLALVEASESRIGGLAEQILLYCFHYDPTQGRYTAVALSSLRIAGVLTVAVLGGLIAFALWRERRNTRRAARAGAALGVSR